MPGAVASAHDEAGLLGGGGNAGDDAAVEFQEVGFDAVGKDDAVHRHLRAEDELMLVFKNARDDADRGVLATEWFAHGPHEAAVVPVQSERGGGVAAGELAEAGGHVE